LYGACCEARRCNCENNANDCCCAWRLHDNGV
jgi:hypothetical protein